MKFRLTLAATLLLGALPLKAYAQQPWLADRRYGEGIGVRVGNLELHPGVSGEVGYDSNYFLRASQEDPLAAYRFRITPSISLATLGPQRREGGSSSGPAAVMFRAGAYVSYNELIAADPAHSTEMSNQRHLDVGSDLSLNLFPKGRVGVDSYAAFVRMVQPSNATDVQDSFNRDSVRLGAGATWRPGGGLFDWRLGYEFLYNYFESAPFTPLNNYQSTVNMRGRWRFLPRTALLYDGGYTWINYARPVEQSNGTVVRSRIGMNGLVTTNLSLLGMVGWAGTFYDARANQAPQQFDSVTGQAEVKWFIGGQALDGAAPVGLSWAALGYTRDVSNSYLGNFYQRDRGYVGISYLLGGVFVASLNAGLANIAFPRSYFPRSPVVQHEPFSEQRFDATLFGEYRLSDTFGVNATVNYNKNLTDQYIPTNQAALNDPNQRDYLAFEQWQAFLGVRWFL